MIFRRIYNWIKFKKINPSVLYQNRLYLERDSKSRRIVSNLGLTFRNSKWANYTRSDINLNLKTSFFNTLILLLALFFSICFVYYFFFFNYNYSLLVDGISYFIWYLRDLLTYSIFSLWSLTFLALSTLFNHLYTVLMCRFFNTTVGLRKKNTFKPKSSAFTSRFDLKSLKYSYYSWILTDLPIQLRTTESLTLLYRRKSFSRKKIFNSFFQTFFIFNVKLSQLPIAINPPLNPPFNSTHTALGLHYFLNKKNLNFKNFFKEQVNPSVSFLYTRYGWNLSSLSLTGLQSLTNSLEGNLYSPLLNFNKLNHFSIRQGFLTAVNEVTSNRVTALKLNKFLYNYNILHRKAVREAYKITSVKQLFSGGFYDQNLSSQNLWASNFFKEHKKPHLILESESNLLYKKFYSTKFFHNYLLPSHSLSTTSLTSTLFNSYEQSYFWFLKRFYLFNNLSVNKVSISLKPRHVSKEQSYDKLNSYRLILTSLLRSDTLVSLNFQTPVLFNNLPTNPHLTYLSNTQDVSLGHYENELVSSDDDLLLADFSANSGLLNRSYYFSNLTNHDQISTFSDLNLTPLSRHSKVRGFFNSRSTLLEEIFLNDLRSLIKFLYR